MNLTTYGSPATDARGPSDLALQMGRRAAAERVATNWQTWRDLHGRGVRHVSKNNCDFLRFFATCRQVAKTRLKKLRLCDMSLRFCDMLSLRFVATCLMSLRFVATCLFVSAILCDMSHFLRHVAIQSWDFAGWRCLAAKNYQWRRFQCSNDIRSKCTYSYVKILVVVHNTPTSAWVPLLICFLRSWPHHGISAQMITSADLAPPIHNLFRRVAPFLLAHTMANYIEIL